MERRILDCFFTVHVQDSKSSQSLGNKSKSGALDAGDSFQDQSIGRDDVSLVVRNVFQHPDVKEPLPPNLESFCFPDIVNIEPVRRTTSYKLTAHIYSFALTDGEGGKTYGFCRRVLPKANHVDVSSKRYPVALCIMSRFAWFTPFFTALRTMDSLFRDVDLKCLEKPEPKLSKDSVIYSFLSKLATGPIPAPGEEFSLDCDGLGSGPHANQRILKFVRPPEIDNPTADISFHQILACLPCTSVVRLLASILSERRMLFVGSDIGVVSSCVHAAAAMIFPLRWQHIFHPILPAYFIDHITAPMPFMIGMHSSLMDRVRQMPISEVVVIDLDTGASGHVEDDVTNLPRSVAKSLLNDLQKLIKVSPNGDPSSAAVAAAFRRFFHHCFGTYRLFVRDDYGEFVGALACSDNWFDYEAMGKAQGSKSMAKFIENCRQTQLFEMFACDRLELRAANYPDDKKDIFEREVDALLEIVGIKAGKNNEIVRIRKITDEILFQAQQTAAKNYRQRKLESKRFLSLNTMSKTLDRLTSLEEAISDTVAVAGRDRVKEDDVENEQSNGCEEDGGEYSLEIIGSTAHQGDILDQDAQDKRAPERGGEESVHDPLAILESEYSTPQNSAEKYRKEDFSEFVHADANSDEAHASTGESSEQSSKNPVPDATDHVSDLPGAQNMKIVGDVSDTITQLRSYYKLRRQASLENQMSPPKAYIDVNELDNAYDENQTDLTPTSNHSPSLISNDSPAEPIPQESSRELDLISWNEDQADSTRKITDLYNLSMLPASPSVPAASPSVQVNGVNSPSTLSTGQFSNAEPDLFGKSLRPPNGQNNSSLNLSSLNLASGLANAKPPSENRRSATNGIASGIKGSQDDFTNLLSDAFTLSPTVNKNQ